MCDINYFKSFLFCIPYSVCCPAAAFFQIANQYTAVFNKVAVSFLHTPIAIKVFGIHDFVGTLF